MSRQNKTGENSMKELIHIKPVVEFKVKTKRKWKVLNEKKKLLELCSQDQEVNLNEVRKILENTKTYYLNKRGLSVEMNEDKVTELNAFYQFAPIEGYKGRKGEPIFAWSEKKKDGKFCFAKFGTRYDFDLMIVKGLKQDPVHLDFLSSGIVI